MNEKYQKFWDKWYMPIMFTIGWFANEIMTRLGWRGYGLWD